MTPRGPDPYDAAAEVVAICHDLIRIDTSNAGDDRGPGERLAAEYVAASLAEVGIDSQILESARGRASVVARWGGQDGDRPPLLVHGHLDVVPAKDGQWTYDPFSGEIVDGYLYGRGAVDMKDFDAMVLSVVRARQRAGRLPDREIVMAFTADEEAGGKYGAHFLVDQHRDLLGDCTEAIGEVGGFSTTIGGNRLYVVEAGEKGSAWMRLTANGQAGHGSMVHPDNAVVALAEAVAAVGAHTWAADPGPSMKLLLAKVRQMTGDDTASDEELIAKFGPAARMLGAGMRDTANPTMLDAGFKVNIVPQSASARVDGRFLPGHETAFLADLQEVVGPHIDIDVDRIEMPLEFAFSGDFVDAMTLALLDVDPDAHVAPYLMSGGTDAKAWDRLGIRSFGFTPLRLPADLDFTALFHGVDERVPTDALEFGARVFDRLLDRA